MSYRITYYNRTVQQNILSLPTTLAARYIALTSRMQEHDANLGEPHTKSLGGGLLELRLKGAEGIARVFYCTMINKEILMLHSFIKKNRQNPRQRTAYRQNPITGAQKMTNEKPLPHEELLEQLLAKPGVAEEVERLNREEYALLDQMLAARKAAGMSQADVAEKMGTKAAAISRLESALASGKHSPSIDTLRRYAEAIGKTLDIRFISK